MNRYATTAMAYYRDYLPTRYVELDDPADYFRDLGEQIQDQVADLTPQLAGRIDRVRASWQRRAD